MIQTAIVCVTVLGLAVLWFAKWLIARGPSDPADRCPSLGNAQRGSYQDPAKLRCEYSEGHAGPHLGIELDSNKKRLEHWWETPRTP